MHKLFDWRYFGTIEQRSKDTEGGRIMPPKLLSRNMHDKTSIFYRNQLMPANTNVNVSLETSEIENDLP